MESGSAPGVAITFDDAYRSVATLGLPVLQSFSYTATVFVVSGQIGGSNVWDEVHGEPSQPLMSESEIVRCVEAGMEIGCHTASHPRLTELAPVELTNEIELSRRHLIEQFAVPVKSFCYPYGSLDDRASSVVQRSGFSWACTTQWGVNRANADPLRLNRMNCTSDLTGFRFARRLLRLLTLGR